jgi:hypothetical protein
MAMGAREALATASQIHGAQARKGTTIPYLSHLLGTCAVALDYGANEDEAIAAHLRDAIEDGEPTQGARAPVGHAFEPAAMGTLPEDVHGMDGAQTSVIFPSGVKWRTEVVRTMSGPQSSPWWYFISQP